MKLLLLPLFFLLSRHNTFGQLQRGTWILDGTLTLKKNRSTEFRNNNNSNIGFFRDIKVQTNTGYFLNRHFVVGLSGAWFQNKRCYTDTTFALKNNSTNNFLFLFPYFRYYFNNGGKYHFFAETTIYHRQALFKKYPKQGLSIYFKIGADYFITPNFALETTLGFDTQYSSVGLGTGLKYFLHTESDEHPKVLSANYIQKNKVTYGANIAMQKTVDNLDLNLNVTIRYFLTHRIAIFLQPHIKYQLKNRIVGGLSNRPNPGLSLGLERHFLLTPKTSLYWAEGFEMPSFAERQQISANYEFFDFSIRSSIGLHRFIAPNLSWFNVVYSDFKFYDNERNVNFQTGFQHFF
jgi:hypothetical protein